MARSGERPKIRPDGAILDAVSGEKVGSIFEIKVAGGGQLGNQGGGRGSGAAPGGGQHSSPATGATMTNDKITVPPHFQVDRRELRRDLLRGIPSPSYGKTFEKFSLSSSGVTAHFADGSSSSEGSLLVAADGVRSRVARQLVGEKSQPLDTGVRLVYGKTSFTPTLLDKIKEELRDGPKLVKDARDPENGVFLLKDNMTFTQSDSPQPYIFWALVGNTASFKVSDDKLFAMSPNQVKDLTLEITRDWRDDIKSILDAQNTDETAAMRMTTSSPTSLPIWETDRRVTLLGDAIHCMPPTGGQGANSAMGDAMELAEQLANGEMDDSGWTRDVIRGYEDGMRGTVQELVRVGHARAVAWFGMKSDIQE